MPQLPSSAPKLNKVRILGILFGALLLMSALGVACARATPAEAEASAHLVVQFADDAAQVRPVSWSGELTRVQALELAGYDVVSDAEGEAICSIQGQGCPANDCFCADNLWAQGQWDGDDWNTDAWPPPAVAEGDVLAFRLGAQPDYSDWGLSGHLLDAPSYVAASEALAWLRTQQGDDGGYDDGFDPIGASVRSLLALGAAGHDPHAWGDPSLSHYLFDSEAERTRAYAQGSAAAAGKLAIAAQWAGLNPMDLAGLDLANEIEASFDPDMGAYGGGSGDTAWAVLGLYAMEQPIPAGVVAFFQDAQLDDGGWSWNELQSESEIQHTAIVIQSLLAAGAPPDGTVVSRALTLVHDAVNPDGGYPYQPSGDSDLGTTAAVVQALLSVGHKTNNGEALDAAHAYLLSMQQEDGSLEAWSPLYATQEVIPALMGRTFGPLPQGD